MDDAIWTDRVAGAHMREIQLSGVDLFDQKPVDPYRAKIDTWRITYKWERLEATSTRHRWASNTRVAQMS